MPFELVVDLRRQLVLHEVRQEAHEIMTAPFRLRAIGAHV